MDVSLNKPSVSQHSDDKSLLIYGWTISMNVECVKHVDIVSGTVEHKINNFSRYKRNNISGCFPLLYSDCGLLQGLHVLFTLLEQRRDFHSRVFPSTEAYE
jgi:hypothetical protein